MEHREHIALRAALDWQIEAGVVDAIAETPVDRYALGSRSPAKAAPGAAIAPGTPERPAAVASRDVDPVAEARRLAEGAPDLEALRAALAGYGHCDLRRGARNLVFSDGVPGARLMILGEAPGRDEDRLGKPFVGQAGQFLDRMLAAIGMSRERDVYITNVLPWRPPQNRDPKPEEIAMMRPFVARHVALAQPEVLILVGNIACDAALDQRGITKLRGQWTEAFGLPALPMFHPAYLLRYPHLKRNSWADLLEVQARLKASG